MSTPTKKAARDALGTIDEEAIRVVRLLAGGQRWMRANVTDPRTHRIDWRIVAELEPAGLVSLDKADGVHIYITLTELTELGELVAEEAAR